MNQNSESQANSISKETQNKTKQISEKVSLATEKQRIWLVN